MRSTNKKRRPAKSQAVGRDQVIYAGNGSVVIGGNLENSLIVTGDHNYVAPAPPKFASVYQDLDAQANLPPTDKEDLRSELQMFEEEDQKGSQANEGFLAQRLRNIKRIAPDILDVVLATIASPRAGFGMIARKVAEKMKEEAQTGG